MSDHLEYFTFKPLPYLLLHHPLTYLLLNYINFISFYNKNKSETFTFYVRDIRAQGFKKILSRTQVRRNLAILQDLEYIRFENKGTLRDGVIIVTLLKKGLIYGG